MRRILEGAQPVLLPTWNEYHRLVAELAEKVVARNGKPPDQIVAIMTGGLYAAKILRAIWGETRTKYGVIAIQSYDAHQARADKDVYLKRKILNTSVELGDDWLLVDDLTESGRTLRLTVEFLREDFQTARTFKRLTVATVFHKETSLFEPDCYAKHIPSENGQCPWVRQPWDQPVPTEP